MLIDIPYKAGDTISLKLASGEEIVARLHEIKDKDLVLTKPMMIAATHEGLGLAPFMFSVAADTRISVNLGNVLCVTKTETEFAKQYTQNTTGIAL